MKVKCLKIYNEHKEEFQTQSSWLTIGKEYIVLEVLCSTQKGVLYRLVGDNSDKSPGVFAAFQFDIVSNLKPSNWEISIKSNGLFVIGPKSWKQPGFWESCYDEKLEALEIYKREARIIYEEEGEI